MFRSFLRIPILLMALLAGGVASALTEVTVYGGVTRGASAAFSYNPYGFGWLTVRSEPEGVLRNTTVAATASGTAVTTEAYDPVTTAFAYWTVNGVAQRGADGVALRKLSLTMPTTDLEIVAVTENDSVRRAKLFWYGNDAVEDASDTDYDGTTLSDEAVAGTSPVHADTSVNGGVARGSSATVSYDGTSGDDPEPPVVAHLVTFDANGGMCARASTTIVNGEEVGELPTATRSNYTFLGWFTAAVGGEQVSSETVVTADVTWYAQWRATYTVIAGAKASVDVGLKGQGYSTRTLPKGLSYSDKTGLVTGTCKTAIDAEGVKVTFTKKNAEDVVVNFVVRKENEPTIACAWLTNGTFVIGVAGGGRGATALPIAIDAESGIKSVTATKLPTGMKIVSSKDKTSWFITGAPTKSGTYEVAITLTTAAGNKTTENFTVTVAALPSGAMGTFNGFVLSDGGHAGRVTLPSDVSSLTSCETLNYGTLQVTVSDVGKIAAKVVTAAGTYSFTATGWDGVNESVYSVEMTTKKGDMLTLACDSGAAWNVKQMTGTFYGAPVTDGKKTTTPSYKVSASGYADVSGIADGAIFADFAPVVSVKSGKTTAKKVLSLRANLWFDKKNEHEEGVGSAVFVP